MHLVGPLGFDLDDRRRRRAGLDYWPWLEWESYADLAAFLSSAAPPPERSWYTTIHASQPYGAVRFRRGDWLFFGKETVGLPRELWEDHPDRCLTIPMRRAARSINLAIAVGIVAYEALRQTGWPTAEGAELS